MRGADGHPVAGEVRVERDVLGEPEVAEARAAVVGDEDVLGLDVAVDEAVFVRVREGAGKLLEDEHALGFRQAAAAIEDRCQRLRLDEFHHEVVVAVDRADVDAADEILVAEGGDGAGLAHEAADVFGVAGDFGGEDLDRHVAVHRELAGAQDGAHGAFADDAEDAVAGDLQISREFRGVRHERIIASRGGRASIPISGERLLAGRSYRRVFQLSADYADFADSGPSYGNLPRP